MLIEINFSQSTESCNQTSLAEPQHAGTDEEIIQVCRGHLALQEEVQIQQSG